MNLTAITPPLGPAAEQQDKLRKNAQAFEAMMLEHWWSAMEKSGLASNEQDPVMSSYQSCGLEAMSLAVAQGGGIGLAHILEKALEAKIAPDENDEGAKTAPAGREGSCPLPMAACRPVAPELAIDVHGEEAKWPARPRG